VSSESQPAAGQSPDAAAAEAQALLFAHDVARLNMLRRAYEQLVPAPVDSAEPHVSVREATALFTDLRHFTHLAETFTDDPAALLMVVNEHLTVVIRAVTRCAGVIEKFVGDGLLATFGARADQPDHRDRALAAALGAIGANERLNRKRSAEWGFRLDMGVGAATGPIVVGRIGSPERSELGVLGDPINVAARLVALAAPGEALFTESVYAGLANTVRADLLGRSAVRGRAGELAVYRVAVLEPRREEVLSA
jgi:adenylate cyclase